MSGLAARSHCQSQTLNRTYKPSVETGTRLALKALEDYYLIGGSRMAARPAQYSESHEGIVPGIKGSCAA